MSHEQVYEWRGSFLTFPSGEGGPLAVDEGGIAATGSYRNFKFAARRTAQRGSLMES